MRKNDQIHIIFGRKQLMNNKIIAMKCTYARTFFQQWFWFWHDFGAEDDDSEHQKTPTKKYQNTQREGREGEKEKKNTKRTYDCFEQCLLQSKRQTTDEDIVNLNERTRISYLLILLKSLFIQQTIIISLSFCLLCAVVFFFRFLFSLMSLWKEWAAALKCEDCRISFLVDSTLILFLIAIFFCLTIFTI